MSKKKTNRREFLKAAIAGAAAAGLSHFRVLNFGGMATVLADNAGCEVGIPDYCNPGEDPDICPDPNSATSSDVCIPEQDEMDECIPMSEPDICDPVNPPPDTCMPPDDPDECEVPPGGPDTCMATPDDADICPDGGPPVGDGDVCNETAPNANPDECIPAVGESDGCTTSAEPDFCRNASGQVVHDICADPDPDICYENGQNGDDICDPTGGDPDAPPNRISLAAFAGKSVSPPGLAAAVVLGGAALLLRDGGTESQEADNTAA